MIDCDQNDNGCSGGTSPRTPLLSLLPSHLSSLLSSLLFSHPLCLAGNLDNAWKFLLEGLPTEACVPYKHYPGPPPPPPPLVCATTNNTNYQPVGSAIRGPSPPWAAVPHLDAVSRLKSINSYCDGADSTPRAESISAGCLNKQMLRSSEIFNPSSLITLLRRGPAVIGIDSPTECCQHCGETAGCVLGVFQPPGLCHLKAAKDIAGGAVAMPGFEGHCLSVVPPLPSFSIMCLTLRPSSGRWRAGCKLRPRIRTLSRSARRPARTARHWSSTRQSPRMPLARRVTWRRCSGS